MRCAKWCALRSAGCLRPAAAIISDNACMVFLWKCNTRSALVGTSKAFCRSLSCVATPTGHWLVWQLCAWIHPTANIKPRAELTQSAPSAMVLEISKALMILPLAPTLICSLSPAPTKVLCTNNKPSRNGVPMWSISSMGAAPVPPSAPSTTIKSGTIFVSSMAFTMLINCQGCPIHNLKPTGFPSESSRSCWINCIISMGVLNAECWDGDTQSCSRLTPRIWAISSEILSLGKIPPWPGFAPCDNLISIILICGKRACWVNFSGSNCPSSVRQPK